MTFLFPLGLAFLTLLPVIVVFHMLRTRRPPLEFSSTMLWQQLTRETTGKVSWRPPTISILLILQLLVVGLLALALAQPALTSAMPPQTAFVIVDASASMQTADVPGGRLAQAKQSATDLINGLNASDRVTIIRAGTRARVVSDSRDRLELLSALNSIEAGGGTADLRGALLLAGALGSGHARPRVYVFSDGALKATDLPAVPAEQIQQMIVGARSFNQAVVTAVARPAFTTGGQYQFFARLANFADQAVEVPVRALADGVLLDRRSVRLPARGQVEMILNLPNGTRNVEFRIDARDDLPLDNVVQIVVPSSETTRVSLVSDVPEPIQRVLKVIPNLKVQVVQAAAYRPESLADVTIFDAVAPAELPSRGSILLVSPPNSVPGLVQVEGNLGRPVPNRWDAQSPLLTAIDPTTLPVARAVRLAKPEWATAVAQAGSSPLILQGVYQGRKVAVFAFDLAGSELTQRVAFPLLVSNAVSWLAPSNLPQSIPPGSAVDLIPPPGTTDVVIRRPDSRLETLAVKADGQSLQFLTTDQIGRYTVTYRSLDREILRQAFAVNVLSEDESDVTLRQVSLTATAPAAVDSAEVSAQSTASYLWPLLTLLALGLLGVEWWGARRWA